MASKTDIANIAVSLHAGDMVDEIDAAPGRLAEWIRALWATTLEAAIAAHPWKFARTSWRDQAALDAAENPDPDGGFAFRQPADCVRVYELRPRIDFAEWGGTGGNVITCSSPVVTLIGTQRGVDVGRFSAPFNDYLGALLGERVCTPVNASEAIRKRCREERMAAFTMAASDNNRVGTVKRVGSDAFLASRIGGASGSWLK